MFKIILLVSALLNIVSISPSWATLALEDTPERIHLFPRPVSFRSHWYTPSNEHSDENVSFQLRNKCNSAQDIYRLLIWEYPKFRRLFHIERSEAESELIETLIRSSEAIDAALRRIESDDSDLRLMLLVMATFSGLEQSVSPTELKEINFRVAMLSGLEIWGFQQREIRITSNSWNYHQIRLLHQKYKAEVISDPSFGLSLFKPQMILDQVLHSIDRAQFTDEKFFQIPLFPYYQFELTDGKHRSGIQLLQAHDLFEEELLGHSPIIELGFWKWVDIQPEFATLPVVRYLNDDERKTYEANVVDGKTVIPARISFRPNQAYLFVIDSEQNIYLSEKDRGSATRPAFAHSTFLSASPVLGFGYMTFHPDGRLKLVNDHSGHYRSPSFHMDQVLRILHEKGIDTRDVEVDLWEKTFH